MIWIADNCRLFPCCYFHIINHGVSTRLLAGDKSLMIYFCWNSNGFGDKVSDDVFPMLLTYQAMYLLIYLMKYQVTYADVL